MDNDSAIGICALCGRSEPLMESHIIPRFAFKWLKDSAATGYLRNITTPNLRSQDGPKRRLLCHDCEEKFCAYEKQFSESIFIPFHSGETTFEYGRWLQLFCASMAWRVVTECTALVAYDSVRPALAEAQRTWQRCLLAGSSEEDVFDHHILFNFPLTDETYDVSFPDKFNWYHCRSIDFTVVTSSSSRVLTYTLLPGIILCSFIEPMNDPDWEDSLVFSRGTTNARNGGWDLPWFHEFYVDRSKKTLGWDMSEKQNEAILRTIMSKPDRLLRSDSIKIHFAENSRLGEANGRENPGKR